MEVFPFSPPDVLVPHRFLHVCGGVSLRPLGLGGLQKFSPRMWRCFLFAKKSRKAMRVFSTYVEVFLFAKKVIELERRFLHVCGGVS